MNLKEAAYKVLDVRTESRSELNIICPVHEDTNPSARANYRKDVWYCHTCHAKGRLSELIKELANSIALDDLDSVSIEELEDDLASLERELTSADHDRHVPEAMLRRYQVDTSYWSDRGLSEQSIERFGFGWERGFRLDGWKRSENVALYPLRDHSGNILGLVRRRLVKYAKPRYLYPEDVSVHDHLFGFYEATQCSRSTTRVAITEGAVDAAALWDAGYVALGQYGTSLSEAQIALLRLLSPVSVVLFYDDDKAGDRAAEGFVTEAGNYVPGAIDKLSAEVVIERVNYGLVRGLDRPRRKRDQLDPAKLSVRQRKLLMEDTSVVGLHA